MSIQPTRMLAQAATPPSKSADQVDKEIHIGVNTLSIISANNPDFKKAIKTLNEALVYDSGKKFITSIKLRAAEIKEMISKLTAGANLSPVEKANLGYLTQYASK